MKCECCTKARQYPGHRMFTPRCIHCGARLIRMIGELTLPRFELSARRKAVLSDWIAHGHSEIEIRRLVKSPEIPLAGGPVVFTESVSPTLARPR